MGEKVAKRGHLIFIAFLTRIQEREHQYRGGHESEKELDEAAKQAPVMW